MSDEAAMPESQILQRSLEAMVLASSRPLSLGQAQAHFAVLWQHLPQDKLLEQQKKVAIAWDSLQTVWQQRESEHGIGLRLVDGGLVFRTQPAFAREVALVLGGKPLRLSRACLETLAIVAYRQPISKPEMDAVRGVDSASTLKWLLEHNFIEVSGRKETLGRSSLYATTQHFLQVFGLPDLAALPSMREYAAMMEVADAPVQTELPLQQALESNQAEPPDTSDLEAAMSHLDDALEVAQKQLHDLSG